ncbi:MAG: hypothetical protein KDA20_02600 [Phycisphaerales bacterium]|nr:hypothetical protein [Phycisphaerales bacterium]
MATLLGQSVAMGQDVPPVSTETLSTSQKSQIEAFVSGQVGAIVRADAPEAAYAAQDRLVELMQSGPISVEYRQEITKSVSPLEPLVGGADAFKAVSALMVAGELAVRPADRMIKAGLNDDREAVRVAAAGAAKRMLRILAASPNQQFFRQPGFGLQEALATALKGEASPLAARAMLHALASTPDDTEFFVKGAEQMAGALEAVAARLRAMPLDQSLSPAWSETLLWGLGASRQALFEANPDRQVSNQAKKSAARMSGLILAMVKAKTAQGADDAGRLERVVSAAEQVLLLVEANLSGSAGTQAVAPAFKEGADGGGWDRFADAVDAWVGARGKLTRAPFGFAAGDF